MLYLLLRTGRDVRVAVAAARHGRPPGASTETAVTAVLTVANLFVTVMRFVAMRLWVFVRR